jgi:hypothetical protein
MASKVCAKRTPCNRYVKREGEKREKRAKLTMQSKIVKGKRDLRLKMKGTRIAKGVFQKENVKGRKELLTEVCERRI